MKIPYNIAAALPNTTVNTQKSNNTKCNTKYEFNLKSLRSQMTVFTDDDHMVILHHFEQHFVTLACEQAHYFKW
jgi:hypothetical protein